jgi:uncharacterized protein with NRDE domain
MASLPNFFKLTQSIIDDNQAARLQIRQHSAKLARVCTLALYFRMFEDYPLVVAANRDEHYDRPSLPPTFLATTPNIIAGKDLRAGGTWLGVNESGLLTGILNRHFDGQNSVVADARSRGLLCMDLLARPSAVAANEWVQNDRFRYNPFTLLFADKIDAFVAYNDEERIITQKLPRGLHVFSSAGAFDLHSAKAERAHALFGQSEIHTCVARGDLKASVAALQVVLSDHSLAPGSDNPGDAICVHCDGSGTVSSSILFYSQSQSCFETFFCAGPPCRNCFGDAMALAVR